MKQKVFYSWQSDTEPKTGRYLLRDALQEALPAVNANLELDEATRGKAGSPDIFATILRKISKAHLFIADLTLVGTYHEDRATPNPNVLIEYGFALGRLGSGRIIPVINSWYGRPELLPFDLRARAVRLQFSADPKEGKEYLKKTRRELVGGLRRELKLALDESIWQGLSEGARLAVEIFIQESDTGCFRDPELEFVQFCELLDLTESDGRGVVDELEGLGLVGKIAGLTNSLASVYPEDQLFWQFDHVFRTWDVEADALRVARRLLKGPRPEGNQLNSARLAEELGWPPRRLNPALKMLVEKGIVNHPEVGGAYPYAVFSILELPETRRFVRRYEPDIS